MRRRDVLLAAGAGLALTAVPKLSLAQPAETPLVAWLSVVGAEGPPWVDLLARGLATEGFTPGENMRLEAVYVDNTPPAIRSGTDAVIAMEPDAIVTGGIERVQAILSATDSIPLVFNNVPDPSAIGLVDNLLRPEGNATGFWVGERPIEPRIETLIALIPNLERIVYLYHLGDEPSDRIGEYGDAISARGFDFAPVGLVDANETEAALSAFRGEFTTGVLISSSGTFYSDRAEVIAGVNRIRMIASYYWTQYARDGGLVSVAPDIYDPFRLCGAYLGRILNGTPVADLPVQAVTKVHLTINLATARFLGIPISVDMREQADELLG